MRISTQQLANASLDAILDRQRSLGKIQLQISSGKRVLVPSDDPVASKRILDLNELMAINEQYQRNSDLAEARLNIEEGSLRQVTGILQRVRDLALQANNATIGIDERRIIAIEVNQLQEQLLGVANTKDSNGEYLFAGFAGNTIPFVRATPTSFVYNGDDGQRQLQIGPTRQIAVGDSGADVFMRIRNGNGSFTVAQNNANTGSGIIDPGSVLDAATWSANAEAYQINFTSATTYEVRDAQNTLVSTATYTDGAAISFAGIQVSIRGTPAVGDQFNVAPSQNQDVFKTLENLKAALAIGATSSASRALGANLINASINDIDRALDRSVGLQAEVGARFNSIDNQRSTTESLIFESKRILSREEDLDMAQAISSMNLQLVALQAAQQVFVRMQNLSLFNYL